MASGIRLTTNEFIQKAISVHGNIYDYSLVNYINSKTKIKIICPIHGEFTQTPLNHAYGKYGCSECGYIKTAKSKRKTLEQFIIDARKIHGNMYSYNKSAYVNTDSKLIITCKKHGDFEQQALAHIRGQGCQQCGYLKTGQVKIESLLSNREHSSKKAILYFMKCFGNNEEFYKIGHTTRDIQTRFCKASEVYDFELIVKKETTLVNARIEELEFINYFNSYKYIPNYHFAGYTECFRKDILNTMGLKI